MHSCVVKARGGLYHLNSLWPVFFISPLPPSPSVQTWLPFLKTKTRRKKTKTHLSHLACIKDMFTFNTIMTQRCHIYRHRGFMAWFPGVPASSQQLTANKTRRGENWVVFFFFLSMSSFTVVPRLSWRLYFLIYIFYLFWMIPVSQEEVKMNQSIDAYAALLSRPSGICTIVLSGDCCNTSFSCDSSSKCSLLSSIGCHTYMT